MLASLKTVPPRYPNPRPIQLYIRETNQKNANFPGLSVLSPTIQYTINELIVGKMIEEIMSTMNFPRKYELTE